MQEGLGVRLRRLRISQGLKQSSVAKIRWGKAWNDFGI